MWAAINVIKSKPKFSIEIKTMASHWHSVSLCNLKENCMLKLNKTWMNDCQASSLFSLPHTAWKWFQIAGFEYSF